MNEARHPEAGTPADPLDALASLLLDLADRDVGAEEEERSESTTGKSGKVRPDVGP